jgi:hypothetical protein
MQSLREINEDMFTCTKMVDIIEAKTTKKKVQFDDLMADIEKTLNTPKKKEESIEDQDEMKPRNYHPPDSPVRRVYENGVEITP